MAQLSRGNLPKKLQPPRCACTCTVTRGVQRLQAAPGDQEGQRHLALTLQVPGWGLGRLGGSWKLLGLAGNLGIIKAEKPRGSEDGSIKVWGMQGGMFWEKDGWFLSSKDP